MTYQKCSHKGVTGITKGRGTGSGRGPKNFAPLYSFRNPFGKCLATPLEGI